MVVLVARVLTLHWVFNVDRGAQIAKVWANISSDTNLLISHSPPYGILDITPRNGHQGCKDLLARVKQLKDLKCNIFGHLHSDTNNNVEEHFGVKFINASVLNNQYKMFNSPVVIDL